MSDKKEPSKADNTTTTNDRRKAVKNILAGSGLTVAAASSGQWSKPLIESVITPAHAQTSSAVFSLAGNIDLNGVSHILEPKSNSILDLFVGTAHAQESLPQLGGACLLITIDGTALSIEVSFASAPTITLQGSLSGDSFTATGDGVTINGTVDLTGPVQTASGTIGDGSPLGSVFNFSLDSSSLDCTPIANATTTTTAATTTADPGTTTTTTADPDG